MTYSKSRHGLAYWFVIEMPRHPDRENARAMDMVAGGATKGMAVGAVLSAERRRPSLFLSVIAVTRYDSSRNARQTGQRTLR